MIIPQKLANAATARNHTSRSGPYEDQCVIKMAVIEVAAPRIPRKFPRLEVSWELSALSDSTKSKVDMSGKAVDTALASMYFEKLVLLTDSVLVVPLKTPEDTAALKLSTCVRKQSPICITCLNDHISEDD